MSSLNEHQATPGASSALSRLGFGCARLFGGSELRRSAKLIEAALDCGIRYFDTAPAYGSEDILGLVLAGVPDVAIATKVGIPRRAGESGVRGVLGPVYRRTLRPLLARAPAVKSRLLNRLRPAVSARALGTPVPKRRLDGAMVMRELHDSLQRLRRPHIDVYLIHEPDQIEISDELRNAFLIAQRQGLIKSFGLAYGAAPSSGQSFGSVLQCRFGEHDAMPPGYGKHIYHGVLRHGLQQNAPQAPRSAGGLIARVLADAPASCVIFSGSTPAQVREIARSIERESSNRRA